ncbi:hypothetical protein IPZ59_13885 [Mongoliitalea daihaiensis]|nr:hypothetical protein IPZ59_13885 [Mongoliitalea daihaiensis]
MKRMLVLCVAFTVLSCMEQETLVPSGSQLLRNIDLSNSLDNVSPWTSVAAVPFIVGVSDEEYFTGNRSLFLEGTDSLARSSVAWVQHYTGPMPNGNRRLRLRAMIKGEDIRLNSVNSNVWMTIRAWPAEGAGGTIGRSVTSQRSNFIEGTFDWTPFELTLPNFPSDANRISVFLVMGPRTTGKIYFDNITLTVE